MRPELSITIRAALATDAPYLLGTYVRQVTAHVEGPGALRTIIARAVHDAAVRAMSTCSVLVACNPEVSDQIYGWVAGRPPVLHWVYVKAAFRGAKVATRLLDAMFASEQRVACSHWTPAMSGLSGGGSRYHHSIEEVRKWGRQ